MTADDAVDALNRFLGLAPEAVSQIICNSRVTVPKDAEAAIEADPTLIPGDRDGAMTLSPLGIINGIFGSRIAAHCGTSDGPVLHFANDYGRKTPCEHPACVAWDAAHPNE